MEHYLTCTVAAATFLRPRTVPQRCCLNIDVQFHSFLHRRYSQLKMKDSLKGNINLIVSKTLGGIDVCNETLDFQQPLVLKIERKAR